MSQNTGTLISAAIRPNDSLDLISTAYANEIKGGAHGYETLSERDSIIIQRRQWGMLVTVYNDNPNNKTYQLKYNNVDTDLLNNLNWVEYNGVSATNNEWQSSVKSIVTTIPTSPNDGDRYLVGINQFSSVIGSPWAGNPGGFISEYNSSTTNWTNTIPTNGMTVRVDDQDNSLYKYEGTYSTGQWNKEKLTQVYSVDFTGDGSLYSTATTPQFSIYESDAIFLSKFDMANSQNVSVNINGIGYKSVKKPSINGLVDLMIYDIQPDNIYTLSYDVNADCFQFIKNYSNDAFNIKYYIEPNDYVVIPQYCQYWVYGDLTVDGTIVNYGRINIANGQLIIGTYGAVENFGEVELISITKTTYRVYTALLTQSGTASPTAIVLENTIGNITWSRVDTGDYNATLNGAFILNKTFTSITPVLNNDYNTINISSNDSIDTINIQVFDRNTYPVDDVLSNTPIEIRVYN